MALAGRFTRAGQGILTAIARVLVGSPRLLYRAGFAERCLEPDFDPLGLGNLQRTATPGVPLLDESMQLVDGGARFTITGPPPVPGEPVALGAAVEKFPPGLHAFRIMATFGRPEGPHTQEDAWAAVVHARRANIEPIERDQRIAVTLQSAWNDSDAAAWLPGRPGAKMNTPLPASGAGAGSWLPPRAFAALFPVIASASAVQPSAIEAERSDVSLPSSRPVFTLALRVDRRIPAGEAALYVRATGDGYMVDPELGYWVGYAERRSFVHPFMAFPRNPAADDIGAAGVLIAIARGSGPASVTLLDFRIFGLGSRDLLYDLLSASWMPDGVAAVLRPVHRRLIDRALGAVSAADRPMQ